MFCKSTVWRQSSTPGCSPAPCRAAGLLPEPPRVPVLSALGDGPVTSWRPARPRGPGRARGARAGGSSGSTGRGPSGGGTFPAPAGSGRSRTSSGRARRRSLEGMREDKDSVTATAPGRLSGTSSTPLGAARRDLAPHRTPSLIATYKPWCPASRGMCEEGAASAPPAAGAAGIGPAPRAPLCPAARSTRAWPGSEGLQHGTAPAPRTPRLQARLGAVLGFFISSVFSLHKNRRVHHRVPHSCAKHLSYVSSVQFTSCTSD